MDAIFCDGDQGSERPERLSSGRFGRIFLPAQGDIKVQIREGDRIIDHLVREGRRSSFRRTFRTAPVRPPDTLGVVVERRRPPGEHEHVIFTATSAGISGGHRFRLRRHRRTFQSGNARFLERRCAAYLQEVRQKSPAA